VNTLGHAAAALAAAILARAYPPPPELAPVAHMSPSAAAALAPFVVDATGVIAFGEVHQVTASTKTRSALTRFTDDVLPALAPRAAHLIVETWMTTGACGAAETRVTEDVARTTRRPAATEDEIVRVLRRAKELGVVPHVLSVSCADYAALSAGGGVDYDKLLTLTRRHLERAIEQAMLLPRAPERPLVLVYGGALHNDLYPQRDTEAYAFGRSVYALLRGNYREVDLYVPELVARVPAMRAERWFAVWRRGARPDVVVTIPRSARSLIVVFPRGIAAQR
jgi:hypothetical protein